MFLPWAKCSHLFWNCYWKIDKSKDQDRDSERERDNEYNRTKKILVRTHGLPNKVGGVADKQLSFMRVGHGNEGKEEGEKMQSLSKWQGGCGTTK